MFSYEEYYKLYNCRVEAEYQEGCARLEETLRLMGQPKERGFREKIFWFLRGQGEFLQTLLRQERKATEEYYNTASLKELQEDQRRLAEDILPEAYATSYTNPAYCISLFGKELGPVMALTAAYFREGIPDAYAHRRFRLNARLKFYFSLSTALTRGQVRAAGVLNQLQRQRRGELEETIKNKVSRLGIADKILFLGRKADAYKYYQAMDLFLLPSRYEGLPVVGVEAQASGLPCVFSDCVTEEAKLLDSTVFVGGEKEEYVEKVLVGLEIERKDTSEEMRKAGFDIKNEAGKLLEFYEGLLKNGK